MQVILPGIKFWKKRRPVIFRNADAREDGRWERKPSEAIARLPAGSRVGPAAFAFERAEERFYSLGLALAEEVFLPPPLAFGHEFFLPVRCVAPDECRALFGLEPIPQTPQPLEAVGRGVPVSRARFQLPFLD